MPKKYDIAIIGGGPGGLTSAIYCGRAGYSSVVIEKMFMGGQMGITSHIENYPGFLSVDGYELSEKMKEQAVHFGADIVSAEVKSVEVDGLEKKIVTDSDEYTARALIVATGASPRHLSVKGEQEYTGRGVSYCATCDGMFYKGKHVAVVGGGDTALEDAAYLAKLCASVTLIHRRNEFRAAASVIRRATEFENVRFILSETVTEIVGDGQRVTSLLLGSGESLTVDGVFVAVGRVPDTKFLEGKLELDGGYIVADETTVTSVGGVFAVGDARKKPLRQIVTACSDGAVAVKYAEEWINE